MDQMFGPYLTTIVVEADPTQRSAIEAIAGMVGDYRFEKHLLLFRFKDKLDEAGDLNRKLKQAGYNTEVHFAM
jgi:hypothetical protein